MQVRITEVDGSLVVELPRALVIRLGLASGQELTVSETASGFGMSTGDSVFEEQMRAAEKIMDEYRETLRELAKT